MLPARRDPPTQAEIRNVGLHIFRTANSPLRQNKDQRGCPVWTIVPAIYRYIYTHICICVYPCLCLHMGIRLLLGAARTLHDSILTPYCQADALDCLRLTWAARDSAMAAGTKIDVARGMWLFLEIGGPSCGRLVSRALIFGVYSIRAPVFLKAPVLGGAWALRPCPLPAPSAPETDQAKGRPCLHTLLQINMEVESGPF